MNRIATVSLFAALTTLSTACGIGAGKGEKYEGLYLASGDETYTVNADGRRGDDIEQKSGGNRTIVEGITSDLIFANEHCQYEATIFEDLATIRGNETCKISEDGYDAEYTVEEGSMKLGEQLVTVKLRGSYTLRFDREYGLPDVTGRFEIDETLTKVGK